MAGAMKTIPADFEIHIIVVIDRIHIGVLRHRGMERRIKNERHRGIGHNLLARLNTEKVGRLMQRRQFCIAAANFQNLIRQ